MKTETLIWYGSLFFSLQFGNFFGFIISRNEIIYLLAGSIIFNLLLSIFLIHIGLTGGIKNEKTK